MLEIKSPLNVLFRENDGRTILFFSLQAIGAKGLHRPLYRPPRRRVHIWRQSGLVPRTSDKVYGGHRVFTANHGGNRAALGQPPRHFARILHEGGGLHAGMAALSTKILTVHYTCNWFPYVALKEKNKAPEPPYIPGSGHQ